MLFVCCSTIIKENDMRNKYAALIAIDWADKKHDVLIQNCQSKERVAHILKHSAQSIQAWIENLEKEYQGKKLAVILEQSKGALINALMKYDCFELYPVNPATLARYRKAFVPSGAKDDPTDAAFMFEILEKHSDRIACLKLDTEKTRTLQFLVEKRRILVNDRKRLGNRLTSLLKEYYPLILELFPKMGRAVLCEFIIKYPTLNDLRDASDIELMEFFRSHRSGGKLKLERRLDLIKSCTAITNDSAIISSCSLMAKAICSQILAIVEYTATFDKQIEQIYTNHEDYKIFNPLT